MIPAPLLVVTDRHGHGRPLVETVRMVLDGGARWVWFRDRDMEPDARRDLAADLLALVREAGGRLSIGGDAGLAAAIGADGVHLSGSILAGCPSPRSVIASGAKQPSEPRRSEIQAGLLRFARNDVGVGSGASGTPQHVGEAITDARRLGATVRVGLSAHSLADVRLASQAGADYVTLSPIFSSLSKPGYGPAMGLDALSTALQTGLPILALGGIGPAQARACRDAGAAGVAVMGGLMRADNPVAQTRALLDALG